MSTEHLLLIDSMITHHAMQLVAAVILVPLIRQLLYSIVASILVGIHAAMTRKPQ